MDYAKFMSSFWTGDTGRALRALGPEVQLVAAYVFTSPHANPIGLYHLPLAYVCNDVGLTREGASKALRSLSEAHFALYDEAREEVFLPSAARIQLGELMSAKDKRHPWLKKELAKLRKHAFLNDFLATYSAAYSLDSVAESKVLASPSEAPSEALRSQQQQQQQHKHENARAGDPDGLRIGLKRGYLDRYQAATGREPAHSRISSPHWESICAEVERRLPGTEPAVAANRVLDAFFACTQGRKLGFAVGQIANGIDAYCAGEPAERPREERGDSGPRMVY
jgi:hypothetical protein